MLLPPHAESLSKGGAYSTAPPMANLGDPDTLAVQEKPPELQEDLTKPRDNDTKRDATDTDLPRHDAKRRRHALTQDVVVYKPQTMETSAAYGALLSVIHHHLGPQPFDVLAGAAHEVLATLKSDRLDGSPPADKKKAIDKLLLNTIPNQLFDLLVSIANLITDFHGAAAGDAAFAPSAPAAKDTAAPADDDVQEDELGEDSDDHVYKLDDDDMQFVLSLDDEADVLILYKPQTEETLAAYKALLGVVQKHIGKGETLEIIAWVADKVLETLKNDELNSADKKKDFEEERFFKTISSQLFDQLVSIGNLITDYRDGVARNAAGLVGADTSRMMRSNGAADTSSSSESESSLSPRKHQKVQIMREMVDLQKREMEWRKKQHEEKICLRKKQHEEKISLRKKDIELKEKQVEAQLITAEAGIMAIDLEKVAPYLKSSYIGMQGLIMERRGFSCPSGS